MYIYVRETASRDPCITLKKPHQILFHCQHDTVLMTLNFFYIRHLICDHCKPLYYGGVKQLIGSAIQGVHYSFCQWCQFITYYYFNALKILLHESLVKMGWDGIKGPA